MQMLCKVANVYSDVRCPVCGQGFLVYWTRNREVSRTEQRNALQHVLRNQHELVAGAEAHAPAFQVPDTPMPLPRHVEQPLPGGAIPVYN